MKDLSKSEFELIETSLHGVREAFYSTEYDDHTVPRPDHTAGATYATERVLIASNIVLRASA